MNVTFPPLDLSLLRGPTVTAVRVGGEVDLATADQLRRRLLEAAEEGPGVVHVDLRAVAFMDTAGLHALLDGASCADRRRGHLGVIAASAPVRRLLAMAGLGFVPTGPARCCHRLRDAR